MSENPKRDQVQMIREAGHVRRCHALVTIGDHYNVAYHSWNATALLLLLNPNPSMNLVKATMFHDIGERYAGDVPAPVKWDYPLFRKVYNELERTITTAMLGEELQLTEDEANWLAAVDALEFFLYCKDQQNLGNQHILRALDNIVGVLQDSPVEPVREFYRSYFWSRKNDRLADVIS